MPPKRYIRWSVACPAKYNLQFLADTVFGACMQLRHIVLYSLLYQGVLYSCTETLRIFSTATSVALPIGWYEYQIRYTINAHQHVFYLLFIFRTLAAAIQPVVTREGRTNVEGQKQIMVLV